MAQDLLDAHAFVGPADCPADEVQQKGAVAQAGVELESAVFVVQQEGFGSAGVREAAAEEQMGQDSKGKDVLFG